MRTVTTARITAMRDAEAEGSEARRVYDACLMRRSIPIRKFDFRYVLSLQKHWQAGESCRM